MWLTLVICTKFAADIEKVNIEDYLYQYFPLIAATIIYPQWQHQNMSGLNFLLLCIELSFQEFNYAQYSAKFCGWQFFNQGLFLVVSRKKLSRTIINPLHLTIGCCVLFSGFRKIQTFCYLTNQKFAVDIFWDHVFFHLTAAKICRITKFLLKVENLYLFP